MMLALVRSGMAWSLNRLEQCFATAWTQWQSSPNVAHLRNAIYALLPGDKCGDTVVLSARCYGALERLVKAYSPSEVNCRGATSSSPIAANLRRLRSRIADDEEAEVIESLDAAINKFSEPTFRDRFSGFRSHWKIPLSMISGRCSLFQRIDILAIGIAHGATFEESEEAEFSPWIAQQHFGVHPGRVICAILDIQLDDTELAPNKARD